ncbi:hypothetical protein DFH09DRAFT_1108099 [Mycena vulgaris]|nr:hypothetical protein DFH09DRAFT_1108099 [Mycena vulgaris]
MNGLPVTTIHGSYKLDRAAFRPDLRRSQFTRTGTDSPVPFRDSLSRATFPQTIYAPFVWDSRTRSPPIPTVGYPTSTPCVRRDEPSLYNAARSQIYLHLKVRGFVYFAVLVATGQPPSVITDVDSSFPSAPLFLCCHCVLIVPAVFRPTPPDLIECTPVPNPSANFLQIHAVDIINGTSYENPSGSDEVGLPGLVIDTDALCIPFQCNLFPTLIHYGTMQRQQDPSNNHEPMGVFSWISSEDPMCTPEEDGETEGPLVRQGRHEWDKRSATQILREHATINYAHCTVDVKSLQRSAVCESGNKTVRFLRGRRLGSKKRPRRFDGVLALEFSRRVSLCSHHCYTFAAPFVVQNGAASPQGEARNERPEQDVEMHWFEKEGHSLNGVEASRAVWQTSLDWFNSYHPWINDSEQKAGSESLAAASFRRSLSESALTISPSVVPNCESTQLLVCRILLSKLPKDGLEEAQSRLQPTSRNEEDSEEHLEKQTKPWTLRFACSKEDWMSGPRTHHLVCDPFGIDGLVPTRERANECLLYIYSDNGGPHSDSKFFFLPQGTPSGIWLLEARTCTSTNAAITEEIDIDMAILVNLAQHSPRIGLKLESLRQSRMRLLAKDFDPYRNDLTRLLGLPLAEVEPIIQPTATHEEPSGCVGNSD